MKTKLTTAIAALVLTSAAMTGSVSAAPVTFDFEGGAQGWTTGADDLTADDNSTGGLNSWALGSGLPGTVGVVLGGTWWTNGNVGEDGAERSFVLSPLLTADGPSMSIGFDSYTSNEDGYPIEYDVEHIQLSVNGGAFFDVHGEVADLHDISADQTIRNFTFVTGGLAAGDSIQYRFLYDTGDDCCGPEDITGWAFDNVVIASVPEPATLALLGIGLAGLGFSRRRKLS